MKRSHGWQSANRAASQLFALFSLFGLSRMLAGAGLQMGRLAKFALAIFGAWLVACGLLVTTFFLLMSGNMARLGEIGLTFATILTLPSVALFVVWLARRRQAERVYDVSREPVETDTGARAARTQARSDRARTPFAGLGIGSHAAVRPFPGRSPAYYRKRAAAYRAGIQKIIKRRRRGPLTETLSAILPKLRRWEERVGQLAGRLQSFEGDSIVQRDITEVPQTIARLSRQIELEADPQYRRQLNETLANYREYQAILADLSRTMRRTHLQLDDTLVAIATLYSQIQMIDAMDIDSPRAASMARELDEQMQRLNDLLSTMPEAYAPIDDLDVFAQVAARRTRLESSGAAGQ